MPALQSLVRWAAHRYLKEFFTPIGAVPVPVGEVDMSRAVGRGYGSNVVTSPLRWITRNFPQAPLTVERQKGDGWDTVDLHAMTELITRPNPWYSGDDLWAATIMSRYLDGNAYWIKRRDGMRAPAELWWAPPGTMEPKSRSRFEFITHYEYTVPGFGKQDLDPEDVVHFRDGIDPANPRKGMSVLGAMLREVFTDDEAARYTAHLLKNSGVPGIVVSPKEGGAVANKDVLKSYLEQTTTGDKRGRPVVLGTPVNLQQFGFEPRRMELSSIRNISEERVCAAIGLPPGIVHFGTGVEQTKVGATLVELHKMAWLDCVTALMRALATTLENSLLPEFEPRPQQFRSRFMTEEVEALQEGQDSLAARNLSLYRGNLIKLGEARTDLGWDPPEVDGYAYEVEPQASSGFGIASRKQATQREQAVIDNATRRRPTEQQLAVMRALETSLVKAEERFAKAVLEWADGFSQRIGKAAEGVIKSRKPNGSHKKDAAADTNQILESLDLAELGEELRKVYGDEYRNVAASVYNALGDTLGLVLGLPDEKAAEIVAEGGTQAGLVDLPKQTRKRLFDELVKAREEGLGPVETERRIRDLVPAGPWKDKKTRSKVIARTETMNAQRKSVLSAYETMGNVGEVMVFDNRTGFGDAECSALDGAIVSLDTARALAADEHPNGTRSFAPVVN